MGDSGDNMKITSTDAQSTNESDAVAVFNDYPSENNVFESYGDFYNMTGDKYLVIINHYKFKKTEFFNYQDYSPRNGTKEDVKRLQQTFGDLGFRITELNDLDYDDIIDHIIQLCEADHQNTSCLAIAILTHGGTDGEVCAADRPYSISDVTEKLQQAPGLAGKPKLLFVQACRGNESDRGHRIQADGEGDTIVIPSHADFLVLFSSNDGYYSYRDSTGSWLIKALCSVISEYHSTLDILQMITLVNRKVALEFTYVPNNAVMHNKKQMPECRFTFTKFLRFS